jgi:CDP-L-myo-inositol myo-inositolphosphotransferase
MGQIIDIGKSLENWQFIDTGVFLMDREVIDTIKYLKTQQGTKVSISEVVKYMADIRKPFKICDVTGEFWADVDTVEDYYSVRKLLKLRTGISNSRE